MIGHALTRRMRSGRRLILSAAAAAALATGLGLFAPTAAHAAPTAVPHAAASSCSSNYVVGSAPLTDENTGVASWNYGYVQLWYSNSCETNWTRVVSLLGGTTSIWAEVDRSDGAEAAASCCTSPCLSPSLYSPVLLDSAYGRVTAAGVDYQARWSQPGY